MRILTNSGIYAREWVRKETWALALNVSMLDSPLESRWEKSISLFAFQTPAYSEGIPMENAGVSYTRKLMQNK